jgi:hypothetical protein
VTQAFNFLFQTGQLTKLKSTATSRRRNARWSRRTTTVAPALLRAEDPVPSLRGSVNLISEGGGRALSMLISSCGSYGMRLPSAFNCTAGCVSLLEK